MFFVKATHPAVLGQSVEHLRYYAGWADKIHGQTIPVDADMQAYTYREPIGDPPTWCVMIGV